MTGRGRKPGRFAVCIDNGEYDAALIVGKIHRVAKPARNDRPSDISTNRMRTTCTREAGSFPSSVP